MWANVEAAKAGDPRTLDGLFLVLPDEVLQDRATAKEFHKEAFQPPIDAVNALSDMRRKAPATVTVNIRGRRVAYATLWDKRQLYHAPSKWTGVCGVCVCVFFPFILDIKLVGRTELFNDWRRRGYDDSVPGEVTKTRSSGDRTT